MLWRCRGASVAIEQGPLTRVTRLVLARSSLDPGLRNGDWTPTPPFTVRLTPIGNLEKQFGIGAQYKQQGRPDVGIRKIDPILRHDTQHQLTAVSVTKPQAVQPPLIRQTLVVFPPRSVHVSTNRQAGPWRAATPGASTRPRPECSDQRSARWDPLPPKTTTDVERPDHHLGIRPRACRRALHRRHERHSGQHRGG